MDIFWFDANGPGAGGDGFVIFTTNAFPFNRPVYIGGASFGNTGAIEDFRRDRWSLTYKNTTPEPATAALGLLGIAGLMLRRRKTA